MPFVAHATPPDYAPKAFCCLKIGGKWKLHHCENGQWKRVYTGLPEDATECSPTAEFVDGRWRISFIAGGHESDRRFYLYKIDGIGNVSEKVVSADVWFIFKNRIVYGGRSGGLYVVSGGSIQMLTFPETVLPNFAELVSPTLSSDERIQAASSAPAYITNFTISPINI